MELAPGLVQSHKLHGRRRHNREDLSLVEAKLKARRLRRRTVAISGVFVQAVEVIDNVDVKVLQHLDDEVALQMFA